MLVGWWLVSWLVDWLLGGLVGWLVSGRAGGRAGVSWLKKNDGHGVMTRID